MRDEEQGGHRWERVRGKHWRRCAPATGDVPMPMRRNWPQGQGGEGSSESHSLGSSPRVTVSLQICCHHES